ncbi:MAG: selenide, water dikinase SelD [Bacteroidetes bacterium]|nr:selenide, water dikinase SelD [Bacteroidota bacterium]
MRPVYLDYNATTPLDPEVAEAMRPFLGEVYGNPSSSHESGIIARQFVENARQALAIMLNAHTDEIIFTGGGTEANNLALKGFAFAHAGKGRHIITSAVEHPAVSDVCRFLGTMGFEITFLPVDSFGMVNPDDFRKAIRPSTILASIMHANNEVGTIQPVEEIGMICREHGIAFHCDAAQSIGKIPVDVLKLHVDLLSVAGHKFYAPKGVGALFCRRGIKLWKMMHGADHEQGLRAGTENIMGIAGMGKAAEIVNREPGARNSEQNPASRIPHPIQTLRDRLHEGIANVFQEIRLNGHPEHSLPNTLSLGFRNRDASVLLNEWKGLAASAGAACHAGLETISAVLMAMNVPRDYALGTIRFSLGRMSTSEEIDRAVEIISGRQIQGVIFNSNRQKPETGFSPENKPAEVYETKSPSAVKKETGLPLESKPASGAETGMSSAVTLKEIRLTEYTHALGCACKIKPRVLEKILKNIRPAIGKNVLVGTETSDDAAVFLFSEEKALVQTVDFIPPVVDDPYHYGAIAAANALSDIWAMGGTPLFALSIVAFPENKIPFEVLQSIILGATEKAAEAGISIIGGHSIEDEEPKFGLVVSGEIHPLKIWRNSTPRAGDALILTKPLGTGIISTAVKRGYASREAAEEAIAIMSALNKRPAELLKQFDVHACTDVTGFGLLGHLKEMLSAGGLSAEIGWEKVPLLSSAWDYAVAGMIPGGTINNLEFVSSMLDCAPSVPEMVKVLLADAQTSGGLLVALPQEQAVLACSVLAAEGMASVIGRIIPGNNRIIVV